HSMEATFCVLPSAAGKWNPFREKRFLILCGKGNNGGDGFVVARRLLLLGAFVHVCTVVSGEEYTGDAAVQYRILKRLVDLASTSPAVPRQSDSSQAFGSLAMPAAKRLTIETFQSDRMSALFSRKSSENDFFWIIDALLGTGAAGALRSPYDQLVRWMNESDKPVFSVDLPSGLDADTGTCCGQAVHATLTCTLAVYKPGLFLPQAAPYVGTLVCGDIGVPLYD
ncbi:MAG: NAD(P)H-hydrate epimerase, partial [Thermoguttaceae bacterium]|nr:NAD(P)H-hydrate epimerase [Thermoguttaceae bacterium]